MKQSESSTGRSSNNRSPVQQTSSTVVVYANSPYQETNEAQLIRKLGEKSKMLEKYEIMLSKVNSEFQNTLNKNKELSNEVSILEIRLKQAEERNLDFKSKLDVDRYGLQRQVDELLLEKDELKNDNFSLNKLLKQKNAEIDELKSSKMELEGQLVSNSSESMKYNRSETELRTFIDSLQKRVIELEYEIKKKDEDYRIDSGNYDLIIQANKKEIEQMIKTRNDLTEQNLQLKEELWKLNLEIRQTNNENDNFKRENLNLKSTIDLIKDNEKELKGENQYLREASLANEKKLLVYQNMLAKQGSLPSEFSSPAGLGKYFEPQRISADYNRASLGASSLQKFNPLDYSPPHNHISSARSESGYPYQNPLRSSVDSLSASDLRGYLPSVKEEPEFARSPETIKIDLGSLARRNMKSKERMDPAMMRPAGKQTSKTKAYNDKYSAHYSSEIQKLNDFSPGRGDF